MIPNVGCERCHGPGQAHIEAARSGAEDRQLSMPFGLDGRSAAEEIRLCGACHRLPETVEPALISPSHSTLVRFQPVGLMQSACFREEPGADVVHDLPRPSCQDVDRLVLPTRPSACLATGSLADHLQGLPLDGLHRLPHAPPRCLPRHDDDRPLDPFPDRNGSRSITLELRELTDSRLVETTIGDDGSTARRSRLSRIRPRRSSGLSRTPSA